MNYKLLYKYVLGVLSGNSRGQVIIILLLVLLLALTITLAITQRATNDLSTSSQSEQSSRAYSAAEAGIESAISQTQLAPTTVISNQTISLGNDTEAQIQNSGLLPVRGSQTAIEYQPISKETIAQFWLYDPTDSTNNYNRTRLNVLWGNPVLAPTYVYDYQNNIFPAVEVNVISCQATAGVCTSYQNQRYYLDSSSAVTDQYGTNRAGQNKFTSVTCNSGASERANTILAQNSQFYCKYEILIANCQLTSCIPLSVRVRLLYANAQHKIAIEPLDGGSFPPQMEIYTSTGKSGQSQKTIQVTRLKDMIPPWIDFAIFSVNNIEK